MSNTETTPEPSKNDIWIAGYLAGMKAASEKAHEYGRRTYGTGGNKVRDALHELGKELDKDVRY